MNKITGNLINAYYVCKRKAWLYAHEIDPDTEHPLLLLGSIYEEHVYKRSKKEIAMEGMKIDVLRKENDIVVVGEVKKSSSFKEAAKMQLIYYLYRLKKEGINITGELLIPKERKKEVVKLTEEMESKLLEDIAELSALINMPTPPPPEKKKHCRGCAYQEFCWA